MVAEFRSWPSGMQLLDLNASRMRDAGVQVGVPTKKSRAIPSQCSPVSEMNPLRDAFAQIPYPSLPRAATAPDRLAAVARLFATTAPNPETARALEIGCSDGGNLISLAMITPQGRFLGIDFSEPAIARGQARIRELQISNIELRAVDL